MSIAKNYFYNVVYQLTTIIIPIITIPYVSRVLGSSGVGINAYTNSIIQYFILLGTIGISLYGNREIAYVRDDSTQLNKTFWGIFLLKLVTTFISFIFFLFFLGFVSNYRFILLLQSIYIFAAAVDISWFYMGLEDFKKTVTRNIFVKITGVVCTFIFVKDSDDLWKYVLILSSTQLLGNISLWFYLPKTIKKIKLTFNDIRKHLVPSISLFIPQVAIQIYVVLNKTMLGALSNPNEVGYFDNADRIIKIVLSFVTAMGTVMLPRVSNAFAKGNIGRVKKYVYNSFNFASFLSIPLMFGIVATANEFAPWFFGPEFDKTGELMVIISPIIVLIAWSNVIGNQFFMPTGQIKGYTISVVIGAIINFLLNLILISRYHSIGVALSTLIAEFSVTAVQFYLARNDLKIKSMIYSTWKYFFCGFMMYLIIEYIGTFFENKLVTLIFQFLTGIVFYFSFLMLLKTKIIKNFIYHLSSRI